MQETEYVLHAMLDSNGHPTVAWLCRWNPGDSQGQWLIDTEFGPFDTRWDLAHWLVGALGFAHAPKVR